MKDANGKYVDLNKNAGTNNLGGKGDRVVYLGFIRTADMNSAITDLAVMNMKGGYSIEDYKDLINRQMSAQIIPFVEGFLAAIREYRTNYDSPIAANRARARAIHDALNLMFDDDCGDAGLGDLLLNETKYEMGDERYNALSEDEKKDHADILTIIQQAHGNAVLLMENLVTRACDTNDDTWIDRFVGNSYEDMLFDTGLSASKARKQLDLLYYDDAMKIVGMWDDFHTILDSFNESVVALDGALRIDIPDAGIDYENTTIENATEEELEAYAHEAAALTETADLAGTEFENVIIGPFLESIDYEDGTLLDFFRQSADEIEDDFTSLYPLVAALSDGQRAGLEFITLSDLIAFAATGEEGYSKFDLGIETGYSIYFGVDRGIYDLDNVALTSDALREGKTGFGFEDTAEAEFALSMWTKIMATLTAASAVSLGAAVFYSKQSQKIIRSLETQIEKMEAELKTLTGENFTPFSELSARIRNSNIKINELKNGILKNEKLLNFEKTAKFDRFGMKNYSIVDEINFNMVKKIKIGNYEGQIKTLTRELQAAQKQTAFYESVMEDLNAEIAPKKAAIASKRAQIATRSRLSRGLVSGGTVLTIVFAAATAYLVYRDFKDMLDRYKVTYTVIPRYMVDVEDIVGYNERGDMIVLKNQSAFYKAALCNRKSGDEWYNILGSVGDLNGTVGKEWLALYAEKNELKPPILADSFLITGKEEIPAGYRTGIHMFGSGSVFNLNNSTLCWNPGAPAIYVYYKTDTSGAGASVSGSVFSAGTAAIFGIGGMAVGALAAAAVMTLVKKKKEIPAEA